MKKKEIKELKIINEEELSNSDDSIIIVDSDINDRKKTPMNPNLIDSDNFSHIVCNELLKKLHTYKKLLQSQKLRLNIKTIIDKYVQYEENKIKKIERLDAQKPLDIIKQDIDNLEAIFYNEYLMKYFRETDTKYTSSYGYTRDEHGGDIEALLKDLKKLQKFVTKQKGTLKIETIEKELTFNKIDNEYLITLYFSKQIDINSVKEEILSLVLNFINSDEVTINKHIKSTIHNYFKSTSFNRMDNQLKNLF